MTTYVVYHIASTRIIKEFNSESSAKRSCTCSNRNTWGKDITPYAYASREVYETEIVKKVKVRNLMSGKLVEIDSNTPLCCDPSSETYWSM